MTPEWSNSFMRMLKMYFLVVYMVHRYIINGRVFQILSVSMFGLLLIHSSNFSLTARQADLTHPVLCGAIYVCHRVHPGPCLPHRAMAKQLVPVCCGHTTLIVVTLTSLLYRVDWMLMMLAMSAGYYGAVR